MDEMRAPVREVTEPARVVELEPNDHEHVDISRERSIERRIPRGNCPGKGIRRRHTLTRRRRRTFVG